MKYPRSPTAQAKKLELSNTDVKTLPPKIKRSVYNSKCKLVKNIQNPMSPGNRETYLDEEASFDSIRSSEDGTPKMSHSDPVELVVSQKLEKREEPSQESHSASFVLEETISSI